MDLWEVDIFAMVNYDVAPKELFQLVFACIYILLDEVSLAFFLMFGFKNVIDTPVLKRQNHTLSLGFKMFSYVLQQRDVDICDMLGVNAMHSSLQTFSLRRCTQETFLNQPSKIITLLIVYHTR